jgi:TolA-binding protein
MKTILKTFLWMIGIGVLLMIPATGGKLFEAVTNKIEPKEAVPENLKNSKAFSGTGDEAKPDAPGQNTASQENMESARTHYMEGLKFFQSGKYKEAKTEWDQGALLDPGNKDIQKALARLNTPAEDSPAPASGTK